MSVTLKLADEDAAVIGSILRAVATQPERDQKSGEIMFRAWYFGVRNAHPNRELAKIAELAGAFKVAVRANER